MLPYVELPSLGPITSFGMLATIGALCAVIAATRHAERLGLDPALVPRLAKYCGIGTLLGAHYVDLVFYQPGWMDRPGALWTFLNPTAGISSYGGFLGATVGFFLFARRHDHRLRLGDVAMMGGLVMLVFGRAGCASVHDHVGVATSSPLAVEFPRGNPAGVVGPHHDLGLYEFVFVACLLALVANLLRTPRRPGWLIGVVAVAYAPPRFLLDTLRRELVDPHFGGLTPAQWGCIATFAAGVFLLARLRRQPAPPPYREVTPWRVHLREVVRPRARQ